MKTLIKFIKALWFGTLATASTDPEQYMETILGSQDDTISIRKNLPFQKTLVAPVVIMTRKQFKSAIFEAEIQGCRKERRHTNPVICKLLYGNSAVHINTIAEARKQQAKHRTH